MSTKSENNRRIRSWGMLPGSQHFGGRMACWNFGMGTKKSDKQVNYSHWPAQTKQQVGYCIVGAFLVHKQTTSKRGFTKLITTQTWGKSPPSPLLYSLCLATMPGPKCHFVLGLPSWSLEFFLIGTLATLEAYNFVFQPSIEVRS
jgi:hypothetical protein